MERDLDGANKWAVYLGMALLMLGSANLDIGIWAMLPGAWFIAGGITRSGDRRWRWAVAGAAILSVGVAAGRLGAALAGDGDVALGWQTLELAIFVGWFTLMGAAAMALFGPR